MKKSICLSIFALTTLLVGCATEEKALVGYWKVINVPDCKIRCSFHVLQYANPKAGYQAIFNGKYGKRASGQIIHQEDGNYVIQAPIGSIPLTLKDGDLHHPRGRVFRKATPISEATPTSSLQ